MPELYFNPACSKCRSALALLDERGVQADVVHYLDVAPTRDDLERLLRLLGAEDPRVMMRTGETLYAELELDSADRDGLLDALRSHPVLLERPIFVRGDKAVIGRPPERVLELV